MMRANTIPPNFKDTIRSFQFESILDHYLPHIKILSLDCFDTLIWRKTATPADMFFAMQEHPTFKKLGMTAQFRHAAEMRAIQLNVLKNLPKEVNLRQIYLENKIDYTNDEILQLTEAELEIETQLSFAFMPIHN